MKFSLKTFFNNLRYLGRYNIKTMNNRQGLSDNELIEQAVYESQSYKVKRPRILKVSESIKYLIESKNSLARFGDGEAIIMNGESIPFQEYDCKLSARLKEILKNNQEGLSVGLNDYYYVVPNLIGEKSNLIKSHHRIAISRQREIINEYVDFSSTYLEARLSSIKDNNDVLNIRKLWNFNTESNIESSVKITGGGG